MSARVYAGQTQDRLDFHR